MSCFTRFLSITHLRGNEFTLMLSLILTLPFCPLNEQNYSNKNGYFLCWSYSQKYPPPHLFSLYPAIKAAEAILADWIAAPSTSCLPCLFLDSQEFLNLLEHYQLEMWEKSCHPHKYVSDLHWKSRQWKCLLHLWLSSTLPLYGKG